MVGTIKNLINKELLINLKWYRVRKVEKEGTRCFLINYKANNTESVLILKRFVAIPTYIYVASKLS